MDDAHVILAIPFIIAGLMCLAYCLDFALLCNVCTFERFEECLWVRDLRECMAQ